MRKIILHAEFKVPNSWASILKHKNASIMFDLDDGDIQLKQLMMIPDQDGIKITKEEYINSRHCKIQLTEGKE